MGKRARRAQAAAKSAVAPARPAAAEAPRDPNAWTVKDRRYWPAVGAVLAVAAVLRLYRLDGPVFQHDEAIYSTFQGAHNFAAYNFDPTYHGPTLYYILKAVFLTFGDDDFTARLVSVAMAFATFALILGPVRRWLGDRAALFALALHAISPVMVAYQRRILFDAFVVVLTLGAVVLFHKARSSVPGTRPWYGAWIGLAALLSAFLATKANAFFVIAMLASFFVADRLRGRGPRDLFLPMPEQVPLLVFGVITAASIFWGPRFPEDVALTKRHEFFLFIVGATSSAFLWEWLRRSRPESRAPVAGSPWRSVALCLAISLVAAAALYFFFFGHGYLWLTKPGEWSWDRYWPDVRDAMTKMLRYWNGQQQTPRLPGRHDFYLPLMIAYELPILVAFIGGVVRASRVRAPFTDLLLWWSFTSWTLYAMANEKVPWLMTHLIAPFALLGGWWLAQLRPRAAGRKVLAVLATLGAAFLLRHVSATSFERAVHNREPMFYAFTPETFQEVLLHAIEASRGRPGDFWIYNAWPPSWYMRRSTQEFGAVAHYPVHPDDDPPAVPLRLVFCTEADWEQYRREERFRGWQTWTWDPKTGRVVAGAAGENPHILNWPRLSWYSLRPDLFARWFVTREAALPSPADHGFFDNSAFLTEWSHVPVVVATPP